MNGACPLPLLTRARCPRAAPRRPQLSTETQRLEFNRMQPTPHLPRCPLFSLLRWQRPRNIQGRHLGTKEGFGEQNSQPEAASRHTPGDHAHTRGYRAGEHVSTASPHVPSVSTPTALPSISNPTRSPRVPTPGSLGFPGGSSTESRGSRRGPRLSSPVRGMGTGQTDPSRGNMRTAAPRPLAARTQAGNEPPAHTFLCGCSARHGTTAAKEPHVLTRAPRGA